ncbi:MAG: HAMP domain-containing protein [Firmicutes bacterium]|nr:HAMP domain-containing protein [Bacillota bacterium]
MLLPIAFCQPHLRTQQGQKGLPGQQCGPCRRTTRRLPRHRWPASFAGIHASRLGQRGLDAVMESIRACYASLWTPRAVAYRRRFNLRDDEVLCAVVLCRMVGACDDPTRQPQAAGVAFSCDPRTGRADVVTIGGVRGLGQAVVDGSGNPEEIVVQVGWDFQVLERREGTDRVLTDEQAIRLAHLVQRVHWALGDGQDPQDVEWAFDGSSFWLLQARPVTRVPRYTFPGAGQLPTVWSNGNLKDALPGVLSPLGWSISAWMIRHNLFAPHRAAGYAVPSGLEAVRRFAGRAYFDLTSLLWAFYDGLAMTAGEFNRSLGGHQPELPVPEPDPLKGPHARRRTRARLKLLRAVLRADKRLPAEVQARLDAVKRHRGVDFAAESLEQLRQRLQDQMEQAYQFGPLSMLANSSAGLWHDLLEKVLLKVAPGQAAALASQLVAGAGNVVSAEHGYRLFNLAAKAAGDAEARTLLASEPLDASAWRRLSADSAFRRELEQFLTVETLAAAAARVAGGDFDVRVEASSHPELRALAEAFNTMAAEVRALFEQQQEAEQARRRLVANVTHDLRTPLTAIAAMIQALRDGVVQDGEGRDRYLRAASQEIEYMSRLLRELSDLLRLESGQIRLEKAPLVLEDLLAEVLEAFGVTMQQKDASFCVDVDPDLPLIEGDAVRLRQALVNVVQNAVQYTPPRGKVRVRATTGAECVRLVVIDEGPGIPPEARSRVFERFYRADPARSRGEGLGPGMGLGLAIAEDIVTKHGGRIGIAEDRTIGTEVWIELPVHSASRRA